MEFSNLEYIKVSVGILTNHNSATYVQPLPDLTSSFSLPSLYYYMYSTLKTLYFTLQVSCPVERVNRQ